MPKQKNNTGKKRGGAITESGIALSKCDEQIKSIKDDMLATVPDIESWTDVNSDVTSKDPKERIKFLWESVEHFQQTIDRFKEVDVDSLSDMDKKQHVDTIVTTCEQDRRIISDAWIIAKKAYLEGGEMGKFHENVTSPVTGYKAWLIRRKGISGVGKRQEGTANDEKKPNRMKVLWVVGIIVAIILVLGFIGWKFVWNAPSEPMNDHTSGVTYKASPKIYSELYPEPTPIIGATENKYSPWGAEYPMGDHRGTMDIIDYSEVRENAANMAKLKKGHLDWLT